MKQIHQTIPKKFGTLPEKVLQFGEGNFLRAFADYAIETANRQGKFGGSVVIAQPIADGLAEKLNAQDCVYTVIQRGMENGAVVERAETITSVSRCINPYTDWEGFLQLAQSETLELILSNTTEAGIAYRAGDALTDAPPVSYPAKLTAFLYRRYTHFQGDAGKGLFLLPCELIEDNGAKLRETVLHYAADWRLEPGFIAWLEQACCFANTLVDRIVTGFPAGEHAALCEKLGYEDAMLDTCEPFFFWAIECPQAWHQRVPLDQLGLDIVFADDIKAYRTRKVRILNGAHTVSVLAAYLAGHDIVSQMVGDDLFRTYINRAVYEEIIPCIPLPEAELHSFAAAVLERFANPFIQHKLLDISLNSISKFCARILPSLLDYVDAKGNVPPVLGFGLAALLRFYQGEENEGCFVGSTGTRSYEIHDDLELCRHIQMPQGDVRRVLADTALWGRDLSAIAGLAETVEGYLTAIREQGIREAVQQLCKN